MQPSKTKNSNTDNIWRISSWIFAIWSESTTAWRMQKSNKTRWRSIRWINSWIIMIKLIIYLWAISILHRAICVCYGCKISLQTCSSEQDHQDHTNHFSLAFLLFWLNNPYLVSCSLLSTIPCSFRQSWNHIQILLECFFDL